MSCSFACFSLDQVNQLVTAGVDVNFFDTKDTQNTPLHWVASFGDANTVECLCGKILTLNIWVKMPEQTVQSKRASFDLGLHCSGVGPGLFNWGFEISNRFKLIHYPNYLNRKV